MLKRSIVKWPLVYQLLILKGANMPYLNQYEAAKNIRSLSFEWAINSTVKIFIDAGQKTPATIQFEELDKFLEKKQKVLHINDLLKTFIIFISENQEKTYEELLQQVNHLKESLRENLADDFPRSDILAKILKQVETLILELQNDFQTQQAKKREHKINNVAQLLSNSGQGFHQKPTDKTPLLESKNMDGENEAEIESRCCRCVIS